MLVLLIIFLLIPFSIHSLSDASKTVEQEIYDFARGSYDLLLRPPDSRTDVEEDLGLVEENYLGIGDGGITVEEWQNVLERDDVEVAAPVAALGLYTANGITYSLPEREDATIRYQVEYTTTDGLHTYEIGDTLTAYTIPDEEESHGYTEIVERSLAGFFNGSYPSFDFPPTYHQVVAIDVDEEEKLTGEDFALLNSGGSGITAEGFQEVSILSLEDAKLPLKAHIQLDTLEITQSELQAMKEEYGGNFISVMYNDEQLYQQLMQDMRDKESLTSNEYELDFSEIVSPFYANLLYADENYQFKLDEIGSGNGRFMAISHYSQETFYDVHPVDYQITDEGLAIDQQGVDESSGIPIYRNIEEKSNYVREDWEIVEGEGIQFYHAGNFDVDTNNEALAASPLGIYGIHETYLADERDTQIQPTAVPGSFITTPARGLVSMEWVEQLKGEEPIDAIRVRVAGIDGYDQAAADKIKDMAQEFEEQGFTVDIVAGASHQWLTIDVEGIGDVVQPWTTLGAADTILQSWDVVSLTLTLLFTLVSMIYLIFSFAHLIKSRQSEEALLQSFGWLKQDIRKLRLKEWSEMVGLPFVVAFLVLVTMSIVLEVPSLVISLGILCLTIIVLMAIVTVFVTKSQDKPQRQGVRKGGITWQNAWYYRRMVIFSMLQVWIMTVVSLFLTLMLEQEHSRTTETTLGVYVHGEMEWFYVVLLVILYTLTVFTLVETLVTLWRQRSHEMTLFHHIGWNQKQLYTFYLREVALWNGFSILIGVMISVIAYQQLIGQVGDQLWPVVLISLFLFLGIMVVSSVVLTSILRRFTKYWYKKKVA
ncbi:putative ABC transport system permease protein [Aquisalibacillus elongatus]|uniref:Putative ABC transport system permease protein n=2 Tax=Aquisalibacillus elongatus TaxID=485577 RepID=A0A3N5BDL1_9BACI|nr:putative ABC transport system permease protein [Aquisalibacillus elongatus]